MRMGDVTRKSSQNFIGRPILFERAQSQLFAPVFFLGTDTVVSRTDARKICLVSNRKLPKKSTEITKIVNYLPLHFHVIRTTLY